MSGGARIYLSAPHMGGDELGLVHEAFESNWLSSVGPQLDAFERELGELVGAPALALASGTAAIHLGLRLLGVGPGDEVICPTLTFVASVNPVRYLGAEPVFVDSDDATWNMDPARLEQALDDMAKAGRRPRAIVVVHLYGQSADMDAILDVARRHDVPVLEDAAEAMGTRYRGRQVGGMADVGVVSFNGNKIITTTGGGALLARDPDRIAKARFWSTQAREPSIAYEHEELGYNYRLSNVLAAIGRGQLRVLEDRVAARRRNAFHYQAAFREAGLEGLDLMSQAGFGRHTNWLSVFTVDEDRLEVRRDALIEALAADDVEARPVWKPMHLQPLYRDRPCYGGEVAERLFDRGICLPSSSSLTEADRGRVIDGIVACVRGAR